MVVKADLEVSIRTYRMDQITDESDSIITTAIATAESKALDYLSPHYDTAHEFAQIGTARNASLVQWIVYISLYLLYERVPDTAVPKRIVKNYDDTISFLEKVNAGEMSVNLKRKVTEEGVKKTKFRGGGDLNRRNNIR